MPGMKMAQPLSSRKVSVWVTSIAIVTVGCLFTVILLHEVFLWLPGSWGAVGEYVYRGVFFVTLPARLLAALPFPQKGHHWPAGHYVITAAMAALYCYGGLRLAKRVWRARRTSSDDTMEDKSVRIPRRAFLARTGLGAAAFAGTGFFSYASVIAPHQVAVRRYTMAVHDLPTALEGLRIVQISDTHYGPYVSLDYLEGVIQQVNSLRGDVVLLTGDYVHKTPASIADGVGVFKGLHAPLGVVGVLGNHDHWEGAGRIRSQFEKISVPLIDNDRVFLTADRMGRTPCSDSICIAGVGDLWEEGVDFDRALQGVPDAMARLVLSHNPDAAESVFGDHRIDMMFSGHTHGGQMLFPGVGPIAPSRYGAKYLGGVCRGPRCPVVVSRGIGMSVVPMRFRVAPELVVVDVHGA